MKCIKYQDGTIKRVHDIEANNKFNNGDCVFVSKTEWKNQMYGLKQDAETRKTYPANIEGSIEFNEAMTKKKEKKGTKTLEVPKKKEQPKSPKKSSKK